MINWRMRRFRKLVGMGCFTLDECKEFSKQAWKGVPYWKQFVQDRQGSLRKAVRMGRASGDSDTQTVTDYIKGVKLIYKGKGWLKRVRGRIKLDVWKMLRDYEDKYRARKPQYESPWQKRQRRMSSEDFHAKAERTMQRQAARG